MKMHIVILYHIRVYADMINMIKLTYVGRCCCWIFSAGDAVQAIAV